MRELGRSGIRVPPLAFGGNVFGWTADEATSFKLLDRFTTAGFSLIDTADVYSRWVPGNAGGESETIIGKWLTVSGMRSKVVVATKVGLDMGGENKGLGRRYIHAACERSLNRLQVGRIDLYQTHRDDPSTPLDETLGALTELVEQGKVRALGASNISAARLSEALEVSRQFKLSRYETLQPGYNLADRAEYEPELMPLCVRESVGVIPYYALASGFLTGKYRSEADLAQSPRGAKAKNYLNPRGMRILAALDAVAARLGSTPTRVALAWLAARPAITAPIVSATSVTQLEDVLASAGLALDGEAVAELDGASAD